MIILASQSPIRRTLLISTGLSISAISPLIDEATIKLANQEQAPEDLAMTLASAKAINVSSNHPNDIIIAADQVLAFGGTTYNKANNLDEARAQLRLMRGHTHHLHTSVACAHQHHMTFSHSTLCTMTMRPFTDEFLENYIAREGAGLLETVGNYKIEGQGLQLFDCIDGDYFSILGLPLLPLLSYLRRDGYLPQ